MRDVIGWIPQLGEIEALGSAAAKE